MFSLKAFVEIPNWVANTQDTFAKFGELSPRSRTYAKDKGLYSDDNYPEVNIVAFTAVEDSTPVAVPQVVLDTVFNFTNWLVTRAAEGTNPTDRDDMFRDIMVSFDSNLSDLEVGEINTDLQDRTLPEQVAFKVIDTENEGAELEVRLWFSEDSFEDQYDDYIIEVIGPCANLDDLFLSPEELQPIIDAQGTPELMNLIQVRAGDYPQTITRTDIYNRVYPSNSEIEIPTEWTVLLYGIAGHNVDVIKNATADYILANSSHTREEWAEILPDIFKSTEYIIVPAWDRYAIPQETLEAGMYAPTIPLSLVRPYADNNVPDGYGYTPEHLDKDVISISGSPYRNVSFVAVGGPENRDATYLLNEQVPDYLRVATTSIEFNRMSAKTQQFALMLNRLLLIAEEADRWSDIPAGYVRIIRDDRIYIANVHERVLYLVIAKSSFVGQVEEISQ